MEKNRSNLPIVVQPNAVTNARYDFSQTQKDFMIHFIEKMNQYMTKDLALSKDLFGNLIIEMDLKDICKSRNYQPMLEAIIDLQKKPISYNYNKGNDTYDVHTTLVATIVNKRGSGKVYIKTTEESLPVISYIGSGYTAFNKTVALSLPSVYAKRLYEICCRWKDKGFYRTTVKEFRKMLMIEDKLPTHNDLEKTVLKRSERILSEQADLTFTYTFRKENKSRSYNWLELIIISTSGEQIEKGVWYNVLYNILYQIYFDSRAMFICDHIADRGDMEMKRGGERFKRLYKDVQTGRLKSHGLVAYVNKVLQEEFEIPASLLASAEQKKKQKKAEERLAAMKRAKEDAARKKAEDKRSSSEMMKDFFEGNTKEEGRTGGTLSLGDIIRNRGRKE